MSDTDEQNDLSVVEKSDDLIDLSDGGDLGSSLLDFQVDNAEVYAQSDNPAISSEASEQSQQQLDLIDHFDIDAQNIQFSEFREVSTDDELIEIHGGVELPDLPEMSPSRLGIAELTTEDSHSHAIDILPPEIPSEAAPTTNADMGVDSEQVDPRTGTSAEPSASSATEPDPATPTPGVTDVTHDSVSLHALLPDIISGGTAVASADVDCGPVATSPTQTEPSTSATQANVVDETKDLQIRFMREIIQSVGDLLTDRVPGSTITVPDSFNEDSAGEIVTMFASIIAQLSAGKTTSTITSTMPTTKIASSKPASTVGSEQPAWADQQKADTTDSESEWVENNDSQPAPDYGLESPVISHLLNTWTTDTSKIEFLKSWVRSLYMPAYESLNYPPGLQITNLSSVLRDGFVVMLVPLIRSLSRPAVVVHIKRHLASQDRLALAHSNTSTGSTGRSVSTDSEHSPTDPFAKTNDVLFDIRIKRLDITLPADSGLHATTEEGYMSDNAAARQYYQSNQGANKFHVDSQYYSPLSEINSALPAIEEKTKRRVFDHAPKQDLEEIMTPPGRGPRHKSFDRDYPGYSSFSRGVDAYSDRGPRSVSFSMPHAPPVPQPTLMESIYSWWGAAPAPAPAPAVCDVPPMAPKSGAEGLERRHTSPGLASVPEEAPRASKTATEPEKAAATPEPRAESPYTSLSEIAAAEKSGRDSATSVPSSARASPAVTPVNKIAERLQKIRDQKQTQV